MKTTTKKAISQLFLNMMASLPATVKHWRLFAAFLPKLRMGCEPHTHQY